MVGKNRFPSLSDKDDLPYTNAVLQVCQFYQLSFRTATKSWNVLSKKSFFSLFKHKWCFLIKIIAKIDQFTGILPSQQSRLCWGSKARPGGYKNFRIYNSKRSDSHWISLPLPPCDHLTMTFNGNCSKKLYRLISDIF